jgi:hypothetical protein
MTAAFSAETALSAFFLLVATALINGFTAREYLWVVPTAAVLAVVAGWVLPTARAAVRRRPKLRSMLSDWGGLVLAVVVVSGALIAVLLSR